jgi:excisionase family DNA binding protein
MRDDTRMKNIYLSLRDIRTLVGGTSVATLRKWVHSGRLPAYYAGGRIVVREQDLMDFLKPVPVGEKESGPDEG